MSQSIIKLINLVPSQRILPIASTIRFNKPKPDERASPEHLAKIEQVALHYAPNFFEESHPLKYFTLDVTFIDNIRGTKSVGINRYTSQLLFIKLYFNLKYSKCSLQLLNLVKDPEESFVRVRWRIVATPKFARILLNFRKVREIDKWVDGISTLHVNKDGKIHCHVCDNIDVNVDEGPKVLIYKQQVMQ